MSPSHLGTSGVACVPTSGSGGSVRGAPSGAVATPCVPLALCAFATLAAALKAGDVAVEDSDGYAEYREQPLPWPEVADYCQAVELPATAGRLRQAPSGGAGVDRQVGGRCVAFLRPRRYRRQGRARDQTRSAPSTLGIGPDVGSRPAVTHARTQHPGHVGQPGPLDRLAKSPRSAV